MTYRSALLLVTLILMTTVVARAATPSPVHIRGTVASVAGSALTIRTATGTETLALPPKCVVTRVVAASRSEIKNDSFVGITSVAGPNGTQRAVEVHVFPERMRGAGEGSRPWDYPTAPGGKSKMTNGTVAMHAVRPSRMTNGTVHTSAGNTVSVSYKQPGGTGAQTIVIPPGVPVVTFAPGTPADLKPGVHVFVMASPGAGGKPVAGRILVGTPGVAPPM